MSDEILRRNKEVTAALQDTAIGRAVRRRTIVLGAIIAAVVLLSLVVGATAWNARTVSRKAEEATRAAATNAQVLYQACVSGNETRVAIASAIRTNSDQIKRSNEILLKAAKIGPQRQLSSQEQKQADAALRFFREENDKSYAQALEQLSKLKPRPCGPRPRRSHVLDP